MRSTGCGRRYAVACGEVRWRVTSDGLPQHAACRASVAGSCHSPGGQPFHEDAAEGVKSQFLRAQHLGQASPRQLRPSAARGRPATRTGRLARTPRHPGYLAGLAVERGAQPARCAWAHGLCRTPGSCWCMRGTPTDLNKRNLVEQSVCTSVYDLDEAGLPAGALTCTRMSTSGTRRRYRILAVADVLCGWPGRLARPRHRGAAGSD